MDLSRIKELIWPKIWTIFGQMYYPSSETVEVGGSPARDPQRSNFSQVAGKVPSSPESVSAHHSPAGVCLHRELSRLLSRLMLAVAQRAYYAAGVEQTAPVLSSP